MTYDDRRNYIIGADVDDDLVWLDGMSERPGYVDYTHEMMLGAVEAVSGIPTGWFAQHDPSPRGLDWPALLEIWGPAALELLDQQQEHGR